MSCNAGVRVTFKRKLRVKQVPRRLDALSRVLLELVLYDEAEAQHQGAQADEEAVEGDERHEDLVRHCGW